MTLPEHRRTTSPVGRAGGTVASRRPGQFDYQPVDRVGFEHVPDDVVTRLWVQRILVGTELIAAALAPVAKRRRDGSHYQCVRAWWLSEDRFVRFDATRELTATGHNKLKPTGLWGAAGQIYAFASPVVTESSTWRQKQGSGDYTKPGGEPLSALFSPSCLRLE